MLQPKLVTEDASKALEICKRLRAAIDYEVKHLYINTKGKQYNFNDFVRHEANLALSIYKHSSRWANIRATIQRYPFADVSGRIHIVKLIREHLTELEDLYESKLIPDTTGIASATASPRNDGGSMGIASATATPRNDDGNMGIASPAARNNIAEDIGDLDVQFLKGVGPQLAIKLKHIGIYSAEDLLNYLPRDHIAYENKIQIRDIREGEDVTICGHIDKVTAFKTPNKNMIIITLVIKDDSGAIKINKFFQGNSTHYYLKQYTSQYPRGTAVLVAGTVKKDKYLGKTIQNPVMEVISEDFTMGDDNIHTGRIVPIYPLTEGLSLLTLRKLIYKTLRLYKNSIREWLPPEILRRYGLMNYAEAIEEIHFPTSLVRKETAATRLIFNEFFLLQLRFMQLRAEYRHKAKGISVNVLGGTPLVDKFRDSLPFRLTGAQETAYYQIVGDISAEAPMHRLLQGDVGSGKTVVAFMALLTVVAEGYQGAVMVPTEILAEQHYRKFQEWVSNMEEQFQVRVGLLIGKLKAAEKRDVLARLANGQIDIVVGTHALIQEKVQFKKLALIVVDEQHRFGVRQRESLARKALTEHSGENELPQVEKLFMTATPIPRTLALTMHGDLDMTEIDEMPAGRLPIITKVVGSSIKKSEVYRQIAEEIAKGNKAYIVFPLIDESESLSAKAATAEYENLKDNIYADNNIIRVGLVHGKLPSDERDEIMAKFRSGEINLLVATTVIEVGVDIREATVMLIESAERFGLAQLHQLRGRVGRNDMQSYCYLHSGSRSANALERLAVLEHTNNGFIVAQQDLRIRGAGDFMGVKQSGLPESALKGLADHEEILNMARKSAEALIEEDAELSEHTVLKQKLEQRDHLSTILGG